MYWLCLLHLPKDRNPNMIIRIAVITFFFLFSNIVVSQETELNFKRYTKSNGLSNNGVTSFAQTPDGYIWIGTSDGLNRFDGTNFKIFRNEPDNDLSISDNSITSLLVDHKGTLWVGTENGGLNKYDTQKEAFERFNYNLLDVNSICSTHITSIKEDINNQIWISTGMGLNLYQPESNDFKRYFRQT